MQNKHKKTVAVLFGGCSTEYGVSLKSAASVIDYLDESQYELVQIGITREGTWLRYGGNADGIREDRWQEHPSCIPAFLSPSREVAGIVELAGTEFRVTPVDVVFPVLHGKNGEDGTVQGLLELAGIPYVGCDTLSSAICMDKGIAGQLVKAAGIDTAASITVYAGDDLYTAVKEAEPLGFPLYIKPARSGSSYGITKAYDKLELMEGIRFAFMHDTKVIVEQNIAGFEVGCAVLGDAEPMIAEIDEIELQGEFFDYDEKYSLISSKIHLPARIPTETADSVMEKAKIIYRVLGCSGLARVDLFISEDGRIVFNEVNTMPGFTAASRYPNMMRASHISYPELMDRLIRLALQKGAAL
ncbi:D-alanine--D-serine ligase VanG [Paenibacillus chibensis]|uniref:D-alanine--D-serine ligase VanG n=1 Tax=Paenibacillus chibensis TaxID=59846 RepID=UPI000FD7C2BC|nr:D-alanine--D-serine ligase VanG [Paenibacillus chibensis]MEC0371763.1 D-alanine--D-serine ligase VanG [Paenibacillus chibensis]